MIKSLAVNITTHNGMGSFIREAILSVRDYCKEIVVVDDGSTDDTRYAIKAEFPDVRLIIYHKPHPTERAMLLNDAKRETKADWVLRIDDDEIMPEETMGEILSLDGDVPVYSIPFLHYEDGHFIDPKCHRKNAFYVARLFKNIPEISWVKQEEVLSYNGKLVSSRGNQPNLCKKINKPFLHFGELREGRGKSGYHFHEPGHCKMPVTDYAKYIPIKN